MITPHESVEALSIASIYTMVSVYVDGRILFRSNAGFPFEDCVILLEKLIPA
jgi:hypothetical protein